MQLAEHQEASRDFTRTLLATSQDILMLSLTNAGDTTVDMASPEKGQGDLAASEDSVSPAAAAAAARLVLSPVGCETKATGDVNEVRSFMFVGDNKYSCGVALCE